MSEDHAGYDVQPVDHNPFPDAPSVAGLLTQEDQIRDPMAFVQILGRGATALGGDIGDIAKSMYEAGPGTLRRVATGEIAPGSPEMAEAARNTALTYGMIPFGGPEGAAFGAGPMLRGGRAGFTSVPELETRLPVETRRVGPYESGTGTKPVGGGDWLDQDLREPGSGLQMSAGDLQNAWDKAVTDTKARSPEQAAFIDQLTANPNFGPGTPEFWDRALAQPDRARYWYEVSTRKIADNAPDADPGQLRKIFDVTAATSPQAEPGLNMRRTVGALAEDAQGQPIMTDLLGEVPVRRALASSGPGLIQGKTGNFSDTFAHIAGLDDRPPISVNDRQVADLHGIGANDLGTSGGRGGAAPYELLSRFYQNFRDAENAARPGVAAGTENPLESWQLQALGWTQRRADKLASKRGIEGMDDYGQVIDRMKNELAAQGVDTSRGLFSNEVLQNPNVPNLVSGTRPYFLSPYTATIESATTMTPQGAQAHALASYLPPPEANLRWADNARYDLDRVQRRAFEGFGQGSDKSPSIAADMVSALIGQKTGLSRIDTRGQGIYEGDLSPNMRIPLVAKTGKGDFDEGQRKALLAGVGEAWNQRAMASSQFEAVEPGADIGNRQRTYSLFIPETTEEGLGNDRIKAFSQQIGGYPLNVSRKANGTLLDVNVGGWDAPPSYDAVKTAAEGLFPEYDRRIIDRAYNSDYMEHPEYEGHLASYWQGERDADNQATDLGGTRPAWDTATRIGNFEAGRQKLRAIAARRDTEYQDWIDKYGSRIQQHQARQTEPAEQPLAPPSTEPAAAPGGYGLTPVEHDPFPAAPGSAATPEQLALLRAGGA